MNCSNSNSPINISSKDVVSTCDLKCKFVYNYPKSTCVVTNKGNYLQLEYAKFNNPPVTYNNIPLSVSDIRIYIPSLHKFNNIRGDGEMVIQHLGQGKSVLVCIPIKISNEESQASDSLKEIIDHAAPFVRNINESVNSNVDFSLDNFIPSSKFYSYTGTLPYEPCDGSNDYIVYNMKDTTLFINNETYNKLQSLIVKQTIPLKKTDYLYINNNGAYSQKTTSLEDDIYIDCQPTGEDGEILLKENKVDETSTSFSAFNGDSLKKLFLNPIFAIIIGILFGGILIALLKKFI